MVMKVIWLVKRKQGITKEQFRASYRLHAPMIKKYIGHTILDYRLNFPDEAFGGINNLSDPKGYIAGPIPLEWDCITEMTLKDRAAFDEGLRITQQPEIAKIIDDDEAKFIDHKSVVTYFAREERYIG